MMYKRAASASDAPPNGVLARHYIWGHGPMASAVARAYNWGLGAEPPAGSRGRAPGQGGDVPLKLKHFWFSDIQ